MRFSLFPLRVSSVLGDFEIFIISLVCEPCAGDFENFEYFPCVCVCVGHILRDLELLFVLEFPVCGLCTERLKVFIIFSVLGDFEFEKNSRVWALY